MTLEDFMGVIDTEVCINIVAPGHDMIASDIISKIPYVYIRDYLDCNVEEIEFKKEKITIKIGW